jgi:hypothetical protein
MINFIVFWLFTLGIVALLCGIQTMGIVLFVAMLVIPLTDDPPAWFR